MHKDGIWSMSRACERFAVNIRVARTTQAGQCSVSCHHHVTGRSLALSAKLYYLAQIRAEGTSAFSRQGFCG